MVAMCAAVAASPASGLHLGFPCEQVQSADRRRVGPVVADGLFDKPALPAGRHDYDYDYDYDYDRQSGTRISGTTGPRP